MRPPFPECTSRPDYDERCRSIGENRRGWHYRGASIVAGDWLYGDGITTWEVWYPGDKHPEGWQTAQQIAQRLGRPDAVPLALL